MTHAIRNSSVKNGFDAANGTAAATFLAGTLSGWTIQEWAAAAALAYSLLLIADKGWTLFQRMRTWWVARRA